MARQGRVYSESGIYHVLLRGVDMLFDSEADYEEMYKILARYVEEGHFRLLAYTMLKNRVHLVINTLNKEIGPTLKPVCTSYARYFNRVHNIEGKLFYDRFKSEPIGLDEVKDAVAFVNAAAVRDNAIHASFFDDESVCNYALDGISEMDYKSVEIKKVFLEDYDCLSAKDINGIIYALSGVRAEGFKLLSKDRQNEAMERLTEKRWIARTKLCEILNVGKTTPKRDKPTAEEKKQEQKSTLSVWLL